MSPRTYALGVAAALFDGRKGHGGKARINRRCMTEAEVAALVEIAFLAGRDDLAKERPQ